MDSGKSTMALQMDHAQASHDRQGLIFTCQDRAGEAFVTSRIGLRRPAREVSPDFDFWGYLVTALSSGERVDYLICDEAQFYSAQQIEQLARVVDELGIDVFCFGLMADFRTELFPGSKRLVELADRVEPMLVLPLCWCGCSATMNARIVDGVMVTEGAQVVVGNTTLADRVPQQVSYEVLCRRHYRLRQPKVGTAATLSPPPLPFGPS